jgi:hypothetical protein
LRRMTRFVSTSSRVSKISRVGSLSSQTGQSVGSELLMNDSEESWWKWISSGSEELIDQGPLTRGNPNWSLMILLIGCVFWLLRRLSPVEHLKHLIPDLRPSSGTPAWFTDLYIFGWWIILFLLALADLQWGVLLTAWCILVAVQIVQTSLYHNIWRTVLTLPSAMTGVYSHVRNLFISLSNILAVWWLFGLAYRSLGPGHFTEEFTSAWRAIYVSAVIGSTLGFDVVHPVPGSGSAQFLVVLEMVLCLTLIAIVIGHGISAVGRLNERPRTAGAAQQPPADDSIAQS